MRGHTRCSLLLLLVCLPLGCRGAAERAEPAPAAAAPETAAAFTVALWNGETVEGPLGWGKGEKVTVAGRVFDAAEIKSITLPEAEAAEPALAAREFPEGFEPLGEEALGEYGRRAREAAERHKGTDAVFCLDRGEDVLLEDGSSIYRYHALLLMLKDAARSHANISLGFREGRSRARVLFARVISADGRSRWAGPDAFTVSVPAQEARFFDKRRRVLSGLIPGAEVGMFVEYAYEYEHYNPELKDFFFPGYFFQSDIPVLDSVIEVLVPAGKGLNYTTRNMPEGACAPKRFSKPGRDGYRWEMHDLAPVEAEPLMPPRSDVVPSVHTSLYFEWKDLMAPTGAFQRERVAATPEVSQLAVKLTEGKKSDDEKVAAIYHWVQRNINYLSIKTSLSSGWAGHPAAETLKNGYGDCTDVSNLTAGLCRAVGIEAYPVTVKTNDAGTAITDIPMPDANHAITLVYPDGRPRFIDATTTDYRYPYFRADDHGVKAIVDMKEEIVDVPVPPPEDNMRESVQEMKLLSDGGAEVTEKNRYNGSYEAGVRSYWRSIPPEFHGRVMQQYLQQRVPGALLTGFDLGDLEDLDEQLGMTIEYRIPVLGSLVKDLYIFTLPGLQQRFGEAALPERVFDIVMTTTLGYSTRVEIVLPEGYELAGAPEDLALAGGHFFFEGSVVTSEDGRSLTVAMLYRRLTRTVAAADYAGFRKNAAAIAAWTDLKIVLRKTAGEREEEAAQ